MRRKECRVCEVSVKSNGRTVECELRERGKMVMMMNCRIMRRRTETN